ncbi:uncharacterized protein LOC127240076 [Andrographis paniculata]|uniref:uncharacterized protein LOC127240076 n=1 Tax=Andrographis paniculata TaxID=175694 RepID=UPI0021E96BD4|nr:uncharacterized protein LOC127240076 [Andrographis paniculata]XP_051114480.1 uncharacterized protein LOC127240076 [Andrographis paniculata]XP_051114481.1 uncharacterized protein LOC127240076 [Andrographis paniculata]XP_051114482.1 uncharacterized protein LOC127240076 [Andrographis paniculata]XP_051114483.1 uncharacterized protein LOC127240076 [Andrographis paniculata]
MNLRKMEPENIKEHLKKNSGDDIGGAPGNIKDSSSSSLEHHNGDSGHLDDSPSKITGQMPQSSTSSEPLVTKNQFPELSPMKSPPVQTMGQPLGYDPNRIPASVFATKPENTADWSTNSNESLFSLHIGNHSFSHDYAIMFGKSGELPGSEDWNSFSANPFKASRELPRLDEWNNKAPPSNPHHQPKPNDSNHLPPAMEAPPTRAPSGKHSEIKNKDDDQIQKSSMESEAVVKPGADQSVASPSVKLSVPEAASPPVNATLTFPSPPRCSDGSGNSSSSFAFPLLANGSAKNAASLKVVPEKTDDSEAESQTQSQPQPESAEETSKAPAKSRWCSCFPCFPQCC